VVALICADARAAREEAGRVQRDSLELRLAVQASKRLTRARTERAAATTAARKDRRRAMTCGSPWSGLEWMRDDEELARVLVPVD
jgi:hypothetical protein